MTCAWCDKPLASFADAQEHHPCPGEVARRKSDARCPAWVDGRHEFGVIHTDAIGGPSRDMDPRTRLVKQCLCGCIIGTARAYT